ncbi:MAG: molybdopterin molybdotransferase [Hyphomicrobiaceae bacterium]|jgi:molybdopterin molybdotransferase
MKPFLELLSASQAYRMIDAAEPTEIIVCAAIAAIGMVLADEVRAGDDIPHFFRSNMDGFAVRAEDTFTAGDNSAVRMSIAGTVAMGAEATQPLPPGMAIRVSTGSMMPPDSDAVVIIENTEEPVPDEILVRAKVLPRQNTVAIGEDMRAGDLVFEAGHRLRPVDAGVLSGVGVIQVRVRRPVRIGVVATGDEIVEPDAPLPPGSVRNVNQYLMRAVALSFGNHVEDFGVIGDDEDAFSRTLERAVEDCDVLFISGGSSRGARDLTVGSVSAMESAEVLFHGLAIAPGKPTLLARAGGLHVMGLPGNPAAAAVVMHLFGSALVGSLEGEPVERILLRRPRVRARLDEDVASPAGREDYLRVRLEPGLGLDLPIARPVRGKSVAISTIARADGLLAVPASTEGLAAGSEVEVVLL